MSETIVNKHGTGQGEYLCLILQTAKRGRKYQTIIIALELGTVIMALCMAQFLSESLAAYEGLPVQIDELTN